MSNSLEIKAVFSPKAKDGYSWKRFSSEVEGVYAAFIAGLTTEQLSTISCRAYATVYSNDESNAWDIEWWFSIPNEVLSIPDAKTLMTLSFAEKKPKTISDQVWKLVPRKKI